MIRKSIQTIFFFPSITKAKILFLLLITFLATVFEGFGMAMLIPLLDFLEKGKDFSVLAQSSRMWLYFGKVFDLLSIPKNLTALLFIAFCLMMIRQVFNYLRATYNALLKETALADIRSEGFKRFISSDIVFYDKYSLGEMINTLTIDGQRSTGRLFSLFNLLGAIFIFVIYFILLLVVSPQMTVSALLVFLLAGIIIRSRIKRSEKLGKEVSEYNQRISSAAVERLSGHRIIKMASREKQETENMKFLAFRVREHSYGIGKVGAKIDALVESLIIMVAFILLFLSTEVYRMSLASIGVFIFVLLRMMPYAREIFNALNAFAQSMGSFNRVRNLFSEAVRNRTIKDGSRSMFPLQQGIFFEGVSFRYEVEHELVLNDINLFIPAGKMTALVGRSGAGKSTLIDLIPRLRDPVEGRIRIDEFPIEEFFLKELRQSIAFVSQEGFLFNDSIENNIRYCRPDATMEEVIEAAKMAYADHFIREFPESYHTRVGERGLKLSGGQRQRIILARALLQKASIIVLDEPTSALDSESEQRIQQAIEKMRSETSITLIIIAHRLSTIKSADQIIVIDKGHVLECGSHKALMFEDAWYADMVKLQAA